MIQQREVAFGDREVVLVVMDNWKMLLIGLGREQGHELCLPELLV